MFGEYYDYKQRAMLITPIIEYGFRSGRSFSPYAVVGIGYTQYRSLEPNAENYYDPSLPEFAWRTEGAMNLSGGLGVKWFLTKRIFVAPEVRVGVVPTLRATVSVGYAF